MLYWRSNHELKSCNKFHSTLQHVILDWRSNPTMNFLVELFHQTLIPINECSRYLATTIWRYFHFSLSITENTTQQSSQFNKPMWSAYSSSPHGLWTWFNHTLQWVLHHLLHDGLISKPHLSPLYFRMPPFLKHYPYRNLPCTPSFMENKPSYVKSSKLEQEKREKNSGEKRFNLATAPYLT